MKFADSVELRSLLRSVSVLLMSLLNWSLVVRASWSDELIYYSLSANILSSFSIYNFSSSSAVISLYSFSLACLASFKLLQNLSLEILNGVWLAIWSIYSASMAFLEYFIVGIGLRISLY